MQLRCFLVHVSGQGSDGLRRAGVQRCCLWVLEVLRRLTTRPKGDGRSATGLPPGPRERSKERRTPQGGSAALLPLGAGSALVDHHTGIMGGQFYCHLVLLSGYRED